MLALEPNQEQETSKHDQIKRFYVFRVEDQEDVLAWTTEMSWPKALSYYELFYSDVWLAECYCVLIKHVLCSAYNYMCTRLY